MTKSIFITATGTDVGKTYVSGLLIKKIRDMGINCGYYKPALSGAEIIDGKLVPGDCAYVLKKAGISAEPLDFVSYVYQPAVSPHLAAQIENKPIRLDKIINDFNIIKQKFDYVIVEGAGGITCPFNLDDERILLPDVIKTLGLDVIIVANAELGTINSTILTIEYAKQNHIEVKGIILNKYKASNIMQADNKKSIEMLTGVKVIATINEDEDNLQIDENCLLELFKEI